jgi:hypothetical protein
MQNFYAWQESSFESMTLLCINVLANNLINRIWGELWSQIQAGARSSLRDFYAWQIYPYRSKA